MSRLRPRTGASREAPPGRGGPRAADSRPHERLATVPVPGDGEGPRPRATLGMVVNLKYPENIEVVAAARRRMAEADCTMFLADANAFVDREDAYERLLVERRLDGLLIATFMPTTGSIEAIARHRLPLVLMNRCIPWLAPGVAVDDEAGMRVAVEHLVRIGHRRIGYIAGPGEADTVHRRLHGFHRALEGAGVQLRPEHVAPSTADQRDGPARAMHQLLHARPRPTAVVLWTVGDAAGTLSAARALGLQVPRDLSVVAFNDAPPTAYLNPPLTCVRMPLWELAEVGVARLFRSLSGHTELGDMLIRTPPELVLRSSTAPPSDPE